MAATALSRRELTAVKLGDSVRQLGRYLEDDKKSTRNLQQKCERIELEKDKLIRDHHVYAEVCY